MITNELFLLYNTFSVINDGETAHLEMKCLYRDFDAAVGRQTCYCFIPTHDTHLYVKLPPLQMAIAKHCVSPEVPITPQTYLMLVPVLHNQILVISSNFRALINNQFKALNPSVWVNIALLVPW